MDREDYVAWLSQIDELSAVQRVEAVRSLEGQAPFDAVVGLLEERVGVDRRCAH